MRKSQFIKITGATLAAAMVRPVLSYGSQSENMVYDQDGENIFSLPELAYDYNSLEPYIDARTMEIHHSKHHAGYVNKLNDALKGSEYAGKELEEILSEIGPDDTAIRNNGGGHYNHSLFWKVMKPGGGGKPNGEVASAIDRNYGSFDRFVEDFSNAAGTVFGSGWAWLCSDENNNLYILTTPNQDNPLMIKFVKKNGIPILGIDVWEHAYYLKYQNRRSEYIASFFNVINWGEVNRRYVGG